MDHGNGRCSKCRHRHISPSRHSGVHRALCLSLSVPQSLIVVQGQVIVMMEEQKPLEKAQHSKLRQLGHRYGEVRRQRQRRGHKTRGVMANRCC